MDRNSPKILVADLVGLAFDAGGAPDASGFRAHVESRGARFHAGSARGVGVEEGRATFFYLPHLSTRDELIAEAGDGLYDAVIAAATFLPVETRFDLGGVRIGTGTGNMGSTSWGGGDGLGGIAPLMNTPGINARATAQMVMKALMRQRPDLPVDEMHDLVVAGRFDTGRDLLRYPTRKLEGQLLAVIGYGNIGREVALLARAFGMEVVIHARPRHRIWIESEGFRYAATPEVAARGADALSVHLGLGPKGPDGFANAGLINEAVLAALAPGAVLLNYDRGELVDTRALDRALSAGQVGFAAIDADLFVDDAGALSGPMQPYLALVAQHGEKLSLLPHAAADTDHPTRVAGAIQAADQLLGAISDRVVRNLKGDLPEGYRDGGALTPAGLGGVVPQDLARFAASGLPAAARALAEAFAAAERGAQSGDALSGEITSGEVTSGALLPGEALMLAANRLARLMREEGLAGPWKG